MKHILNNLSEEEKNAIREQHTGGMKVMTENFNKLINSKLGDAKPLVSEQPVSRPTSRPSTPRTSGTTTGTKPKPTSLPPTNLVGKEILLYSDSSQQKIFKKATIKQVRKFSDGSVAINLRVDGDVTNHLFPTIYFSCLKSAKLSYSYYENQDTPKPKIVEVYCVPLLKILKNDYCMVGAGGILVPKVDLGDNSSKSDVYVA
jgi:hypothetical protein